MIRSRRQKSRKTCKSKTLKKVCGPRKSCEYPNTYTRKELLKIAIDNPYLINKPEEKIKTYGKNELCSRLELKNKEYVKNIRIINNKSCGPDISPQTKDTTWSRKNINEFVVKNKIFSKSKTNKLSKAELCSAISDFEIQHRISPKIKLIDVEQKFAEIKYKGFSNYIAPVIYNLIKKHKNFDMYINKNPVLNDRFYHSIYYDCHKSIYIKDDLITKMKNSKCRFYICLVNLKGKHSNFILYDKQINEIYSFEPLGSYSKCKERIYLDNFLESYFKIYLKAKYFKPIDICPMVGPQKFTISQRYKLGLHYKEDEVSGLCVIWSIFILDMKLTYPNKNIKNLITKILNLLKEEPYGAENYIRSYFESITQKYKIEKLTTMIQKIENELENRC